MIRTTLRTCWLFFHYLMHCSVRNTCAGRRKGQGMGSGGRHCGAAPLVHWHTSHLQKPMRTELIVLEKLRYSFGFRVSFRVLGASGMVGSRKSRQVGPQQLLWSPWAKCIVYICIGALAKTANNLKARDDSVEKFKSQITSGTLEVFLENGKPVILKIIAWGSLVMRSFDGSCRVSHVYNYQ